MKRSRFREEQIIGILREAEAGAKTADLCRKHGISAGTFYNWKAKFGGMDVSEAKRLRTRGRERQAEAAFGHAMLDQAALKALLSKDGRVSHSASHRASGRRVGALGARACTITAADRTSCVTGGVARMMRRSVASMA
jgi:putative transposase